MIPIIRYRRFAAAVELVALIPLTFGGAAYGSTAPESHMAESMRTMMASSFAHTVITDGADTPYFPAGRLSALGHAISHPSVTVPLWGRYCGPGHSGPGAPIDALDTACMHHDHCYDTRVHPNGESLEEQEYCDEKLIEEVREHYETMNGYERTAASFFALTFAMKGASSLAL